ncbi:MAG: hypothetical protein ACYCZQ_03295 [Burkholderiales bacterium]
MEQRNDYETRDRLTRLEVLTEKVTEEVSKIEVLTEKHINEDTKIFTEVMKSNVLLQATLTNLNSTVMELKDTLKDASGRIGTLEKNKYQLYGMIVGISSAVTIFGWIIDYVIRLLVK